MGSRTFARCLGVALVPLALCCIVANVLLFFPSGNTQHAGEGHLTVYVWLFAGMAGGGLVMFLPAAVFINLGDCAGCCGHRDCGKGCALLCSVVAALLGLAGSGFCFVVSGLALTEGPMCLYEGNWTYPFQGQHGEYLTDHSLWARCTKPYNVVEWNVVLFSILLALSCIEILICGIQAINGLLGGVCRACCYRSHYTMNPSTPMLATSTDA